TLLAILLVAGLAFIVRETRTSHPIVSFRPLKERNYLVSCIIIFCTYAALYAASVSLPSLLQTLLGYDAFRSGLVMSPSGIASICVMIVVGALIGRGLDARWLIGCGLIVVGLSNLWMSNATLQMSPFFVIWPRVVLSAGLGLIFAPL